MKYYRRRHRDSAIIHPLRSTGMASEISQELTDLNLKDRPHDSEQDNKGADERDP